MGRGKPGPDALRPSQELAIALAGPAVNVAIAVALLGAIILAGTGPQAFFLNLAGTGAFLLNLMWVNVALVVFNLLPAFPMDGGRVLRAFLAMQLPYVTATTIAARVGQVIAVILGLFGLFSRPISPRMTAITCPTRAATVVAVT